jgi:hypothetical protein
MNKTYSEWGRNDYNSNFNKNGLIKLKDYSEDTKIYQNDNDILKKDNSENQSKDLDDKDLKID